jgi:hypothetical protein
MIKRQDICYDGKVNHYYQLRTAYDTATSRQVENESES